MNNTTEDQATFEYVGFGFSLEEATKLMHQEVMYKKDLNKPRALENIGIVSGVLHLNEEIEIVIQFYEHIVQFTQAEYEASLKIVTDDHP